MASANASVPFEGAIPNEAVRETDFPVPGAEASSPAAESEHHCSGLLLDDPVLGFPGGSLFPTADDQVDVSVAASNQGSPTTVTVHDSGSTTTTETLRASPGSQGSQGSQGDPPPRPRLCRIAPKPADDDALSRPVQPGIRKPAVRTKRAPFKTPLLRAETSLTRTLNSCVRCRVLRNRCSPNPTDPLGPCLACMRTAPKLARLPCLRYKVTESNLYRTAFQHFDFFRTHLMVGPTYGDFHIKRQWALGEAKVLEFAQDSNVILKLRVREFVPTAEELAFDDTRGNKMYAIPWAIDDPDEATRSVNLYIDRCIGPYLEAILDDSNPLVSDVFSWALRLSMLPDTAVALTAQNKLLSNVIRIWVACRFLEGRWRCSGGDTLGAQGLSHRYDGEAFVQVPPFINYQMAALFTERILGPLRGTALKLLQDAILANKTSNWFVIFLSVFILLHNYELQCRFHRAFARRRGFAVRFVDMPIIRAIHSGAKTILAHFHYCCKGQRPFSPDANWDSPDMKRMAQLDDEQIQFLKRYQDLVWLKAPVLQTVSQTHDYEAEHWFIAQIFDDDWVPRQTNEHSLPA